LHEFLKVAFADTFKITYKSLVNQLIF